MADIKDIDLGTYVRNAVKMVFDTMLSMKIESIEADLSQISDKSRMVGSVSLAGDVMGNINTHVSQGYARMITAAMLGMEEDEIEGTEEMNDVLGEICNMVGGDIKSRLCDAGFHCELSIPSITSGSDFKIESKGWVINNHYGFRYEQNIAFVEIYIKI